MPVSYVHLDETFDIPAGKDFKKVRNLRRDLKASILIGVEESESGVTLECQATVLENENGRNPRNFIRDKKGWKIDETTVIITLHPLNTIFWSPKEVMIRQTTHLIVSEYVECYYSETRKWAEMKLEPDVWSLDCSKYRLLLFSRFLRLPKFISRAFCLAGIAKEEQVEECLQN